MLICFLVVVEALLKVIGDSDDERPRIQNPEFEPRTWFSILKIGFFFGFLVYLFIHSNCIIGAWWFLFISHWIIIDIWRQSFHFILVKFWSLLVFFHWINFSFNQFSLSVCVFYVYISLWNIFQKKPAKIQTHSQFSKSMMQNHWIVFVLVLF